MSSPKRSSACRKSYTGSAGEIELIKSLELLFYVCGKKYQKHTPDFIIPSAYEFLGYARAVSDEVYNKSRKTIAINQLYNGASKSTIQKILYSRPFLSTKHSTTNIFEFLQFIHGSYTASNAMLCISTVYYAVTLYYFLQECMNIPVTWGLFEAGKQPSYGPSITQFCTSHMPVLYHVRHAVIKGIASFLHNVIESMRAHIHASKFEAGALTSALAFATAAGVEKHLIRNPAYKKQVLQPLLRTINDAGIQT